jgi:succinyl-CoA synthetase beta subunit
VGVDLLEYQGKRLFYDAGIPIPPSWVAADVDEANEIAAEQGLPLVVKAQLLSGGRGKGGGVVIVHSYAEFTAAAEQLFWLTLDGRRAEHLLVERAVDIAHEFYMAIALDRTARRPVLLFSAQGGVDIEQLAKDDPAAILRLPIDPLAGLVQAQTDRVVAEAGEALPEPAKEALAGIIANLARLYHDNDATLVEINPLALTTDGRLLALDAKITLDDNALPRHTDLEQWRTFADARERRAHMASVTYVALDGEIGVIGNGAGLVMSVLDLIDLAGGQAGDFCDVGGGARAGAVRGAVDIVLADENVTVLLVSIFGGITHGDEVARGVLDGLAASDRSLPVVVRLAGTGAEEGRRLLAASGRAGLTVIENLDDAVAAAVAAARGGS